MGVDALREISLVLNAPMLHKPTPIAVTIS
jgi:hypothetical protein